MQASIAHKGARPQRPCGAPQHTAQDRRQRCSPHQPSLVAHAITKEKKNTIVANLTDKLNESTLCYGLSYEKCTVRQVEGMRRALPDSCSMVVTKNRLLRVAVDNLGEEGAARWEGLKGQKGMNAYVFAPEDDVRGAVKAFNGFLEDLKKGQPDPKRGQEPPPPPSEIKCIVMDGQTLDQAQWKTLEKIPTKQELIQKFAIAVKANPLKIARGVKMVPNKIAYAVQALAELNDDKSMTVEEAAKLKAEAGDA